MMLEAPSTQCLFWAAQDLERREQRLRNLKAELINLQR